MAYLSMMKRRILIGFPRKFAIQTTKMDLSQISFDELLFQNITKKKTIFGK